MVMVLATADEEGDPRGKDDVIEIFPVIGILVDEGHFYDRQEIPGRPRPRKKSLDPGLMERWGWEYRESDYRFLAIVVSPDGEILTEGAAAGTGDNVAWGLAACPWDPSEDSDRLGKIIAEVQHRARERLAFLRKMQRKDSRNA